MKRHRFDPVSFAFGAFFLLVSVLALAGNRTLLDVMQAGWPVLLIAVGLGIVFSARKQKVR